MKYQVVLGRGSIRQSATPPFPTSITPSPAGARFFGNGESGRVEVGTACIGFADCLELADGNRNVDLYHWSSAKFSSTWYDTLSVLVAKGRAQVGVAASSGDWSKRIRDMQYTDHEDYAVGS